MIRRLTLLIVLSLCAMRVEAQPWPSGVTPPVFVVPASAVNGGGQIITPLIGAVGCTAPPFTFVGHLTTGFCWGNTSAEPTFPSGIAVGSDASTPGGIIAAGQISENTGGSAAIVDVGRASTGVVQLGGSRVLIRAVGLGSGAAQLAAAQTTAPTCTTNCGSPQGSCVGSDTFMTCTMGTTPASGFVIAFNGTWAAAPACIVQMALAGMASGKQALTAATTTAQITIVTNGVPPSTSDKYHIQCGGVQ